MHNTHIKRLNTLIVSNKKKYCINHFGIEK